MLAALLGDLFLSKSYGAFDLLIEGACGLLTALLNLTIVLLTWSSALILSTLVTLLIARMD